MSTIKGLAAGFAADRKITVDEAKQLVAKANENGSVSRYDKLQLRNVIAQYQSQFEPGALDVLRPLVGSLPNTPAPITGGATVLSAPNSERPVYLSKDGVFSLKADGSAPSTALDKADAAYRAAELVDNASGNLFQDAGISKDTRAKLFDRLSGDLASVSGRGPAAGLNEQQTLQMRSSLATVLTQLMEASPEPELQTKMLATFEKMVRAEPNKRLRENMIFHFANSASAQTGKGKEVSAALMKELAPMTPPYEKWFANGNKTVNLQWTVGGDGVFWGGFTNYLKQNGFKPVGPENQSSVTIYERTINKPGVGDTTFRISVREGGTNVLAPMNDPNTQIVGYDGHSNWGRNMSASVKNGPQDPAGGDGKLLFYNLCVGKGVLDKVREKYPDAQVATTFAASNFYTDSNGQMTRGEGVQALMALVNGISERADWTKIHKDMNRAADIGWGRTWDNYMTPISTLEREKVLDRDNDGQADYLDKHFNFDTAAVAEDTRRELTPVKQSRPAGVLDGTKVLVSANMVNTLSEFSSVLDPANRDSKVVANGWFDPKMGDKDVVKFDVVKGAGGKTEYRMSVSSRYAHASEETLRLLGAYEFNRYLAQNGKLPRGMDAADMKIAGLIIAAQSLDVDDGYRDDEVWGQFLQRYNLPDVPRREVQALLDAEHRNYAGSPEMVRALKAKLSPATLEALKKPQAGEPINLIA